MIILTIKTNEPISEFAIYADHKLLQKVEYQAHWDLASTIHAKIHDLLKKQKLDWSNIEGVVCFKGPGSFTGLRIGLSVANTLAYGLNIPIIGSERTKWTEQSIDKLLGGASDKLVQPFYGAEPHITQAKK